MFYDYKDPKYPDGLNENENETLIGYIFQIWDETTIGPSFKSLKEAEDYLDSQNDEDYNWRKESKIQGYPEIIKIKIGDKNFMRDR